MPRKSAASLADSTLSLPPPSNGDPPPAEVGDSSTLSAAAETPTAASKPKTPKKDKDEQDFGVEDLLLPRTLTSRLAKGILPANTSIQKDALLALTKAATVFVSYLAHNANEQTTRKTVGPQDVLKALQEIEMEGVMGLGETGKDGKLGGRLERELEVYEEGLRGKRKGYRDKLKARESGVSATANNVGAEGDAEEEGNERDFKRPRVSTGADGAHARSSPGQKTPSARPVNGAPAIDCPTSPANGTAPAKTGERDDDTLSEDDPEKATGEIDAEAGDEVDEDEDPDEDDDENDDNDDEGPDEQDDESGDGDQDGPGKQLRGEIYGIDDAEEGDDDDSD